MEKYRIIKKGSDYIVQTEVSAGVQWDPYTDWRDLYTSPEYQLAFDFLEKLRVLNSVTILHETEF